MISIPLTPRLPESIVLQESSNYSSTQKWDTKYLSNEVNTIRMSLDFDQIQISA